MHLCDPDDVMNDDFQASNPDVEQKNATEAASLRIQRCEKAPFHICLLGDVETWSLFQVLMMPEMEKACHFHLL